MKCSFKTEENSPAMELKKTSSKQLDISFVIVNWNTKNLLMDCLHSVFDTVTGINFEVWVVDNGSKDGSAEAVAGFYPQVNLIANETNRGFAAANNQAFEQMNGRYALLLNSDAALQSGAADELYNFMENTPGAGMACGQLLNPDGSLQNAFAPFPCFWTLLFNESLLRLVLPRRFTPKNIKADRPLPVDSCIGACMIVRRRAMDRVGFFDESFFFFLEETDWAYRMRKDGWGIFFVPSARILHHQGASIGITARGRKLFYRSRYLYLRKWHPNLAVAAPVLISVRLAVNALLNLAAVLLTLGLNKSFRRKFSVYLDLIRWHLAGCPKPLPPGEK
ncbi:MAG: glycosyltransferase family 2 protein [Desulfatiglandaceae bacterium]